MKSERDAWLAGRERESNQPREQGKMDSRDSNVQQNSPIMCKNGCGFYSNAGSEGLCSVCYKEFVKQAPPTSMPASFSPSSPSTSSLSSLSKEEILPPSPAPSLSGAQPTVPIVSPPGDREEDLRAAGSSQDTDKDGEKDGKKKKNRCLTCKKKVGLTGFTCRCGGLFCSIHRYSDKHQCDFDYKALGAEEISKSNPVVVAQKVAKI